MRFVVVYTNIRNGYTYLFATIAPTAEDALVRFEGWIGESSYGRDYVPLYVGRTPKVGDDTPGGWALLKVLPPSRPFWTVGHNAMIKP